MAYAEISDLEKRWRALGTDELVKAETLLEDAATIIDSTVNVDQDDEMQVAAALVVSCNMVRRAMSVGDAAYGVSQTDHTMGPFGWTDHFSNPNGDMYLTSKELGWLGGSDGYIIDMRPVIGGADA